MAIWATVPVFGLMSVIFGDEKIYLSLGIGAGYGNRKIHDEGLLRIMLA